MALFNRLLTHVQNRKRELTDIKDEVLWHKHSTTKHPPANVRVVLFRECERKGKKLLFDSLTVKKIEPREQNPADHSYTEVTDGIAYKYLPSHSDAKLISEMIFGSASITYHAGNMKIHKLADGTEVMWSSIFQAPTISKKPFKTNPEHSDTSLGSSFGCSLGSFPSNEQEDIFSLSLFPDILEDSSMRTDSGCYTSFTSFSQQGASFTSFPATETSFTSFPNMDFESMSSNLDLSDHGSVCSLQRRWLSTVQSSLLTRDLSSPILRETGQSPVKFGISPNPTAESLQGSPRLSSSRFGSEVARDNLRQGGRHAVLGLGIIIKPPESKLLEVFYSNNLILEDIYYKLLHIVQQAYIHKKRFVATMFHGFLECERMVRDMFTVPSLKLSAWHLLTQNQVDIVLQNKLLNDLCYLKKTYDTKETNFFISTFLTGILTYHLGWVTTVMPASQPGQNLLNKHQVLGMDILSHWYNPVRMQFRELHGMLGCPVRAAKSLILANKEDVAKKFVFVLSYFIRCSQVFKQDLTWEKSDMEDFSSEDLKTFVIKKDYSANEKPVPDLVNVPSSKNFRQQSSQNSPSILSKSNSSPNITTNCKPNLGALSSNRIPTLSAALAALDLTPTLGKSKRSKENDKVLFLVGDDDEKSSEADKPAHEEQFDSGLDVEFSADETEKSKPSKAFNSIFETESEEDETKSEHNDEAKVVITKAVTVSMEPEEPSSFVAVEVPVPSFSTRTSAPAELPSRICCSSNFVTGTILQGMYGDATNWREEVKEDLAAAKFNSFIRAATEECVCLVGDVNKLEVSLVTAQNKLGLPVPMSPLVAGVLDEVVAAAEAGLPVSDVLRYLEDRLQVIYLHSCTLAEYLLTADLLDLQSLASSLDLDPCDVPLLLVLKLDPDHTGADEVFKRAMTLKQKKDEGNEAFKKGDMTKALKRYAEALAIDPLNTTINAKLYFNRGNVQAKLGNLKESVEDCTKALVLDVNYTKALLLRAKSCMELRDYESAVADYTRLCESDRTNMEYKSLLKEAKLKKVRPTKKDYYKILGVERGASDEEIKKGYRKQAMKHHPDKHADGTIEEKLEHEKIFKEIAQAYAILSDPKQKLMYDQGGDGGRNPEEATMDGEAIWKAFFKMKKGRSPTRFDRKCAGFL